MIEIATIVGFHGLHGEVKVLFSQRLFNNLSVLETVYVYTSPDKYEELEIEDFKVHKSNILIKFSKYSSKNDVEHLKGAKLKQKKDLLAPLEEEEYFIDDLIGLDVFDETGNLTGKIDSIYPHAGSNGLIEIKTPDKKLKLIPFVEHIVPVVDIENKKIVINNLPGLLDD
jgi:16S rRNA processing protein RimM